MTPCARRTSPDPDVQPRFYRMSEVTVLLATSEGQVRAMVRNGDLPAMKIGGRGQWRIERTRLDEWIEQQHRATAQWVKDNSFIN